MLSPKQFHRGMLFVFIAYLMLVVPAMGVWLWSVNAQTVPPIPSQPYLPELFPLTEWCSDELFDFGNTILIYDVRSGTTSLKRSNALADDFSNMRAVTTYQYTSASTIKNFFPPDAVRIVNFWLSNKDKTETVYGSFWQMPSTLELQGAYYMRLNKLEWNDISVQVTGCLSWELTAVGEELLKVLKGQP